ncbi:peroxiredoxin [Roseobacter sp. EG26]|uniref:peroxiredoxin n=1 Tax=Roseobacter sp. EG26 TaxID=3412477 RepID=UPI003CE4D32A
MTLTIGSKAPNFTAMTTKGMIHFHNWIGDHWCLFFSHPKDFTPVCTTELGAVARDMPEFERRGVKVIGLSVDPIEAHHRWKEDIEETQGVSLEYPLISDPELAVAKTYGMLPAQTEGVATDRTAMDNQTARSVFIIAPNKTIRAAITYPMTAGRNFTELLRVIDSLQMTDLHKVATPANWQRGEDVIILPALQDDAAKSAFPEGWTAPRPYLRFVADPVQ